jgi:hypothetical protein
MNGGGQSANAFAVPSLRTADSLPTGSAITRVPRESHYLGEQPL